MVQNNLSSLPAPPPLTANKALFLDFDGTLVDIATTPEDIRVAENLGGLLQCVARALDGALAVISGRAIASIDRYLGEAVQAVAGIHGAIRRDAQGALTTTAVNTDTLHICRAILKDFTSQHDGLLLEDKTISLALHFRTNPDLAEACARIVDQCVESAQGLFERLDGKMVVELKPARITKARALAAYMNEAPFQGRVPVFVGDDITDENGFAAVKDMGGFGVIVGPRTPTAATARLGSVAELHRWLDIFCTEAAL